MTIALPPFPAGVNATLSMLDFGSVQPAMLGGPDQAISRLGARFQATFTLPVMQPSMARRWNARRNKSVATKTPVSCAFPQLAPDGGLAPGAPVVDGAGQSGVILNVRGMNPGFIAPEGLYFCFTFNGRSYLHQVADAVIAGADGKAAVSISPMLRVSPADGAALNMTDPVIEGFLTGSSVDWSIERLTFVSQSFAIREVE